MKVGPVSESPFRRRKDEKMQVSKKWVVVGAVAALGVSGGLGAAALGLNDRPSTEETAAAVMLTTAVADEVSADDSPESADSPNESATESADSATDSPDDPGYVDPSPESADSPNESAADSPAGLASADSPAAAPAPVRPKVQSVASADSPAPAPVVKQVVPDSADSPVSAVSADSPDVASADSAG